MAFETPSLDDNHAFLLLVLASLLPGADITEGAFNWLWLKSIAAGVSGNDAHLDAAKDELLEDTAVDNLPRFSNLQPGGPIPRKGATPAWKSNALRVSGTAAATVPDGAELANDAGILYRIEGGDVVGPGLFVDVDVVALSTGAVTRMSAGDTLTFSSGTPAGLDDTATLVLDIDEDGEDLEAIEAWRSRILSKKRATPRGGKQEDYVQWALEVQGVGAAFSYPTRNGRGTVDVVGLHNGTGDARTLEGPERGDLQAYLDTKRPTPATVRVLETLTSAVDIEYLVVESSEPQFAFDWDDSGTPTVAAFNATTNVMEFSGGRPADLEAGHRIILFPIGGIGYSGAERKVDALGPGFDEITLEADDAGDVPGVGDYVFSGGPLVQPVREALLGLVNTLGPANPSKKYGSWEGSVRPKAIERLAASVPGVTDDGDCIDPTSVVDAVDPVPFDDLTIGLLVPGRIFVHRST